MISVILASASPRRRAFLSEIGLKFDTHPSSVEEHTGEGLSPQVMVAENARRKALDIFEKHPDSWVLAADTTVELDGDIFNKPKTMDEAERMLERLSGKVHAVHTAVHILGPDAEISHIETSKVLFRILDRACIADYFSKVCPLDRAGAYSIQDGMDLIIEGFEGSFSNIAGLPMEWLTEVLEEHGLIKPRE